MPKRQCWFTEDQYVASNRFGPEAGRRAAYRQHIADGIIPPRCERCGYHHKPVAAVTRRNAANAASKRAATFEIADIAARPRSPAGSWPLLARFEALAALGLTDDEIRQSVRWRDSRSWYHYTRQVKVRMALRRGRGWFQQQKAIFAAIGESIYPSTHPGAPTPSSTAPASRDET